MRRITVPNKAPPSRNAKKKFLNFLAFRHGSHKAAKAKSAWLKKRDNSFLQNWLKLSPKNPRRRSSD